MPIKFTKRLIDKAPYEAASVFDVNNDGHLDIVSGEYWYAGPDFQQKVKICDVMPVEEWYDDFCDYPLDVTGNGRMDIITGAWFSGILRWRENPGTTDTWAVHDIDDCGNIETIRFVDIDNCGTVEVFPNTPGAPQAFYKLVKDAQGRGTGRFEKHVISEGPSGHGMGFGDINGNGRTDIILAHGWLEQPDNPLDGPWTFHEEFDLASASVPIIAHDVNGNGLTDLIVGQAHDYGLAWWEQTIDTQGKRHWRKHDIDPDNSQYHDLWLVDLDNDGELELVTGKRYRAHNGNDPGADDTIGLYYFKIDSGRFTKHVIDYGSPDEASACGIYFWIEDIDGNGRLDIVAPGKEGLYLFTNEGIE